MVYKAVAGPHSKQWTIKKSRLYKQAHFKLKNKQTRERQWHKRSVYYSRERLSY